MAMVDGTLARAWLTAVSPEQAAMRAFRVLPYLQDPSSTSMRVTWFTTEDAPGELTLTQGGQSIRHRSTPQRRTELGYSPLEESEREDFPDMFSPGTNFKHRIHLAGLKPDTEYAYTVTQGPSTYRGTFRTAPAAARRPI
jgi:phosphodiesterase/alkaline phosphatase D-like protein